MFLQWPGPGSGELLWCQWTFSAHFIVFRHFYSFQSLQAHSPRNNHVHPDPANTSACDHPMGCSRTHASACVERFAGLGSYNMCVFFLTCIAHSISSCFSLFIWVNLHSSRQRKILHFTLCWQPLSRSSSRRWLTWVASLAGEWLICLQTTFSIRNYVGKSA